jgi:hypothetical protein
MEISRNGNYTKFNIHSKNIYLAYVAKNKDDNYFNVMKLLQKKDHKISSFQVCEKLEEKNNFKNIFYIFYNIYGKPVKYIFIYFDFENNIVITENGKKYKILKDFEYTYKIQKTQIKAINGIKGFYNHIVESMNVNSAFNSSTYNIIDKL